MCESGEMATGPHVKLVSTVITTYGDPSSLSRAVESVLNQTYKAIELLVVDDNPPTSVFRAATEVIMGGYSEDRRVSYIRHSCNLNGSAARNTGIARAGGAFITFLDNDDFMLPSRVESAVQALERDLSAGAVFCGVACYSGRQLNNVVYPSLEQLNQTGLLVNDSLIGTGSNLFFRAEVIKEVGLFDTSFRRHQDLEYVMRFFRTGHATTVHDVQLVKTAGGTDNTPGYADAVQAKRHFHMVFKADIDNLCAHDRAMYEINVCNVLLDACVKSRDKESAKRVVRYRNRVLSDSGMRISLFSSLKFGARLCTPGLYGTLRRLIGPVKQICERRKIAPRRLREIECVMGQG